MDLVVIHNIHDPEGWQTALNQEHEDAPGSLRSFVESTDGTRALCLWEAPDLNALKEHLDRLYGHAVVNDVFPVKVNYFEGRVEFS